MIPTYIKGLSSGDVVKLQKRYGQNTIEEKFDSTLKRFFKKFVGPIPLMIEAALLLSFFAGRWEDFFIIALLLGVNVAIDFLQEQKAHKALDALKETLAPTAVVLRNGKLTKIAARDLVPTDTVKLSIGDIIPADAKIIENGVELSIDQSQITGEALPVSKHKGDTLHAGSIIQRGGSYATVTAIGKDSAIGKNAALVARAEREKESHFQKAILNIGHFLIIFASILIVLVSTVLIMRGDSVIETVRFALVLAVASIPVALPAVLSVTMAIGAALLAKKGVIVSKFKSLEELAGVDVLCTDKTGTVTKNTLTVEQPQVYGDFDINTLFTYALLASEPERSTPVEHSIDTYAQKNTLGVGIEEFELIKFEAFDPRVKTTSAHVRFKGIEYTIVMGATQVVREQISGGDLPSSFISAVEQFASQGFKTIAVGVKQKGESTFTPVGIIPLLDPPREDSKTVIAYLRHMGLEIKMLTGDHTAIARYIAKLLDIGNKVVEGKQVQTFIDSEGTRDDIDIITKTNVFAEVAPEHKYHIVDVLQSNGYMVAMTGDGVNDAPALKKADIGIAVAGATPAARSAADLILLTNGLSVIKRALDYARMIFARMTSYATFRIAETIRIILFITLALLVFDYAPLSAVMIILLALLNDIPVMAIAYDNAPVQDTPMRWQLRETLFIAIVLGVTGVISSFGLFYWLNVQGVSIAVIQAILFLKLDVAGHSTLYLTRTGRKHFWERPYPSLKFFIPAFSSRIIGTVIVAFGIFMAQLSIQTIIYIWIYATIWFVINDYIKVWSYKLLDAWHVWRKCSHHPVVI